MCFFHQVQCNTLFDSPSRSKPCFHHIAFNSFHVAWRVENNIYPAEFNYVRRHPERSYSHKSCTNSHTGLQLQMELQEQEWLMVIALQCLVKVYEVWHMWDHLRHVLVFVCFFFFSLMNICLCFSSPFLLPNFPVQSNASVPGWLNSSSTRWKRKTKFNTEILLKVLAKDSMKCCCLSDGGWQRTISVWHLARILQNVNAGMRSWNFFVNHLAWHLLKQTYSAVSYFIQAMF